jgi:phospholipase/carboxylesterase
VTLQYLERLPKEPTENGKPPLVILLHGRAAEAKTIFSIEGLLDPRFHIVAFQAPFESALGAYEWFRPEEKEQRRELWEGDRFSAAEQQLTQDIPFYLSQAEVDPTKLFLWGFSQGAAMSLILGLRGVIKPKGVVPMAGFLPSPIKRWESVDRHAKYLLVHGTNDEVLPTASSLSALKFLLEHGVRAEYHEYRGRHKMTLDSIAYINNWLRNESGLD